MSELILSSTNSIIGNIPIIQESYNGNSYNIMHGYELDLSQYTGQYIYLDYFKVKKTTQSQASQILPYFIKITGTDPIFNETFPSTLQNIINENVLFSYSLTYNYDGANRTFSVTEINEDDNYIYYSLNNSFMFKLNTSDRYAIILFYNTFDTEQLDNTTVAGSNQFPISQNDNKINIKASLRIMIDNNLYPNESQAVFYWDYNRGIISPTTPGAFYGFPYYDNSDISNRSNLITPMIDIYAIQDFKISIGYNIFASYEASIYTDITTISNIDYMTSFAYEFSTADSQFNNTFYCIIYYYTYNNIETNYIKLHLYKKLGNNPIAYNDINTILSHNFNMEYITTFTKDINQISNTYNFNRFTISDITLENNTTYYLFIEPFLSDNNDNNRFVPLNSYPISETNYTINNVIRCKIDKTNISNNLNNRVFLDIDKNDNPTYNPITLGRPEYGNAYLTSSQEIDNNGGNGFGKFTNGYLAPAILLSNNPLLTPLCISGNTLCLTSLGYIYANNIKIGDKLIDILGNEDEILDIVQSKTYNITKIPKNSLGKDQPFIDLYITRTHNINHNDIIITSELINNAIDIKLIQPMYIYTFATKRVNYLKMNGLNIASWDIDNLSNHPLYKINKTIY